METSPVFQYHPDPVIEKTDKNKIVVTTTNLVDGYKVEKYIGPIVANVVIGAGIISEFFAGISDMIGGRSDKYQNQISAMYETAIDKIKEAASEKGANCILGLAIDLDEISGKGMQMFMLNAIGTAAIINPLA
jgi:uncharacterized protein YbjQ (UPF0145 family)